MKSSLLQLSRIFKQRADIKLVYLFGSRAHDETGPLSDYDFALYADTQDFKRLYDLKLSIQDELSRSLKTDNVDVVVLNTTESPELKYEIITKGKLIFEREPFRVMIEPKILNEYFDFHLQLERYGLTKAKP